MDKYLRIETVSFEVKIILVS